MKQSEISIGNVYETIVSGELTQVRVRAISGDDAAARSAAFAALWRIAKVGQPVWVRTNAGTGGVAERTGILRELLPDGLVLDTDSGTEYVPADQVETWRLPKTAS